MSRSKAETIRRLRQGDLIRLCQHRYGERLPNDDAGRETLFDLVCLASLAAFNPTKKMTNIIELQAPWISPNEADEIIDDVSRMQRSERWRILKTLGERHRLTYAERERIGGLSILPCDVTREELAKRRKARARSRKRQARAEARARSGGRTRAEYEANSLSRRKPWEAFGWSERHWRRMGKPDPGDVRSTIRGANGHHVRNAVRNKDILGTDATSDIGPAATAAGLPVRTVDLALRQKLKPDGGWRSIEMAFKFASEAERLAVAGRHAEIYRLAVRGEIDSETMLRLSQELLKPYRKRRGKAAKAPFVRQISTIRRG